MLLPSPLKVESTLPMTSLYRSWVSWTSFGMVRRKTNCIIYVDVLQQHTKVGGCISMTYTLAHTEVLLILTPAMNVTQDHSLLMAVASHVTIELKPQTPNLHRSQQPSNQVPSKIIFKMHKFEYVLCCFAPNC